MPDGSATRTKSPTPHLFTYFTTNGYTHDGDNVGGWNTDATGWVHVDDTLYPGVTFSTLLTDDGEHYIGYYPVSLFMAAGNAADSLADHSNVIDFYGEIYISGDAVATTGMGSDEFPDSGCGKAAYIHNIANINTENIYIDYNGDDQFVVSDSTRYNIVTSWSSGSTWGNYVYLGGPGAGGEIGA